MNELDWLLLAYQFDTHGGATPLTKKQINENHIIEPHWVHLHADYPETEKWLNERSNLDRLVIDALIADETRPRMFEHEDGCIIILRGMNLNENADEEDMVSIRMYINKDLIISVRKRALRAVVDIEESFIKNKGPKNTGDFLTVLIEGLGDHMEPTLSQINDHIDDLEENLLILESHDLTFRQKVSDIRRKAIIFRRYLAPQREVLNKLKILNQSWLSKPNKRHISENYDRLTRFLEDLEAIRERAQIVHDELRNSLTDRTNRNMYIVSIFSSVFLPLGFVTGLFGVNLNGIPGAQESFAFTGFVILLLFVTIILIYLFKKLKLI